jgi:hypothetical protein
VNNDGKPNLNNSEADNENDARLAARCKGYSLMHAFEPAAYHTACFAQACLDFKDICFVCEVKLKYCPQVKRSHFGKGVCFEQITRLVRFWCVLG